MFFLLLKKNYSISILHGSESLPVVVITIHPPKGRQATPKGQPKDGEVYFPSLYGSPGASWQDIPDVYTSGISCLPDLRLRYSIRDAKQGIEGGKSPLTSF